MVTTMTNRWLEAQDSPGIIFKGSSLLVGSKLNCSRAASRPGFLPFISQISFPDLIATEEVTKQTFSLFSMLRQL